jgi:hypothetical protein
MQTRGSVATPAMQVAVLGPMVPSPNGSNADDTSVRGVVLPMM